ncbi:phage holin family protein [Candidatus Parcubacteria bacterium]|nr:phage holin family protein [Candidatus Parcubacteria bacterium]
MKIILRLLISAGAIAVAVKLLPGVHVSGGWQTYLILAIVLAAINFFIKPVLLLLTLPLSILTLGLFTVVLNAALVFLATKIVPGFTVDSFLYAVYFGVVLAIVNGVLKRLDD